jgi:DNA helicase-2/ATP-dependent DNA helicase PcrA
MKGNTPLQAIQTIRNQLGYEEKLVKISEELGFNKDYLIGILYTLEEISDSLETMEDFANRLKHLESVLNNSKFSKNKHVVTLSTLHSSKGLEFKKVYMVDLIDGVIPTKEELKQFEEGNIQLLEESVRLFYVGMTRAEHSLELLTYKKKFGRTVIASQFVRDVRNIIAPPVQIQRKEPIKKDNPINP